MTTKNPILDELHDTRERLLAESGGTLSGLVARLQAEQAASDRPQYNGQTIVRSTDAAKSGEAQVENQSSPPTGDQ